VTDRLEVNSISTGYGDLQAVWDISVSVSAGEATVILGPNGAGKTTTLSAIMGLLPLWKGSVVWKGKNISRVPAYKRVSLGIGLVQEGKRIFRERTVEENLLLAAYYTIRRRRDITAAIERQYVRFPVLKERRKLAASTLSGGEQQMLAIAQALIPSPSILILDEPTAGLAPVIVKQLFAAITALKAEGVGILLVEQVIHDALALADQVVVLDVGRSVYAAPAKEGIDSKLIQEIYFGGSGKELATQAGGDTGNEPEIIR